MGVVAVSRDRVQEWVRPAPLTTTGEADFFPVASGTVRVSGVARASLVPMMLVPARVAVAGVTEPISPFGDVQFFPRPVAGASLVFDNTGSTVRNVREVACIALAAIRAPMLNITIDGVFGVAGVLFVATCDAAVPQEGAASFTMEYYGDGSVPIFPFKLPLLFLPIDFSNLDAAALLDFDGEAQVGAGGFGDADLPEFTGDAVLDIQGSTPIFPFYFPVAFDTAANINRGFARVVVEVFGDVEAGVAGVGLAPVVGLGLSENAAFFPFAFPVILQQIFAAAFVYVFSADDVTVLVDGVGAIDVYTVAVTELE